MNMKTTILSKHMVIHKKYLFGLRIIGQQLPRTGLASGEQGVTWLQKDTMNHIFNGLLPSILLL